MCNTSAKQLKDKLKKFKTLWVKSLRVRYTGFSLRIQVTGLTLQDNNLKKAPVRLNEKIIIGYRTLAGDFSVLNRELSDC